MNVQNNIHNGALSQIPGPVERLESLIECQHTELNDADVSTTILVVEDNSDMRYYIAHTLSKCNRHDNEPQDIIVGDYMRDLFRQLAG
jgi:hypothetical protein